MRKKVLSLSANDRFILMIRDGIYDVSRNGELITYEKISEMLGITAAGVQMRRNYALKRLKKSLSKHKELMDLME